MKKFMKMSGGGNGSERKGMNNKEGAHIPGRQGREPGLNPKREEQEEERGGGERQNGMKIHGEKGEGENGQERGKAGLRGKEREVSVQHIRFSGEKRGMSHSQKRAPVSLVGQHYIVRQDVKGIQSSPNGGFSVRTRKLLRRGVKENLLVL